jgi:hypothetical protein
MLDATVSRIRAVAAALVGEAANDAAGKNPIRASRCIA